MIEVVSTGIQQVAEELMIKTMERIDLTIRSTVFFCYSGEGFARKENIAIAQTAY